MLRRERIGAAVPILRVQDGELARDFYGGYLGFTTVFEHRFEPGLPLYQRLRRGSCEIDLSEHHGDGTPGAALWIPVADVEALHAELTERGHPRLRPGVEHDSPGGPTMAIIDPFGNTLRFCQPIG